MEQVPVISLEPYLVNPESSEAQNIIEQIYNAASTWGFFVLTDTSVSPAAQAGLLEQSKAFFDLPLQSKMAIDVTEGGVAWRGYMPLGGEHTHGKPDWKEGLYLGPEHPADHPLSGMPLHGKNQFPDEILPEMRGAILEYIQQTTELGKTLTDIFSSGLKLGKGGLRDRWLQPEPVVLFRCFKYAPMTEERQKVDPQTGFGIGEHTDFGYLTILKVESLGLQVLSPTDIWVDVPLIDNALVVNVGDMFDRLTNGRFPSRPHRVVRPSPSSPPRFSFPTFFDFSWTAKMEHLPLDHLPPLSDEEQRRAKDRWAKTTFREVKGTWAQYLARKVQKVFPNLNLPDFEANASASTRFTRVVKTA